MGGENPERPDKPDVTFILGYTDLQRNGQAHCLTNPVADAIAEQAAMMTVRGTTNFEDKDLETMLAMVTVAKPQELQDVATDLWDAAGKIKAVATEMSGYLKKVDWEGQFGTAFSNWTVKLGENITLAGDYTEQASTHMMVAGEGVQNVQKAIGDVPASILSAKRLDTMTEAEKEDEDALQKAKDKEEKRQEVITQMNRLASYYRVSHDNMAAKEVPTFGPLPDIGMPMPAPVTGDPSSGGSTDGGVHSVSNEGAAPYSAGAAAGAVSGARSSFGETPVSYTPSVSPGPSGAGTPVANIPPIGTEINQTGPITPTPTVPSPTPSPSSPPPANTHQNPHLLPGPVGPTNVPPPGGRTTLPPKETLTPRQAGPTGPRNGPINQGPISGPPGKPTTGLPPAGRVPNLGTPTGGRAPAIFGGTASEHGPSTGPRLPRTPVVGNEHGPMGRPPMGMGGPMGGPPASGGGYTNRRLASNPGGIVGTPRSIPTVGDTPRPFTPGGSGLAQEPSSGRQHAAGMVPRTGATPPAGREERQNESRRPDYVTEDEETWVGGGNGHVPPVID